MLQLLILTIVSLGLAVDTAARLDLQSMCMNFLPWWSTALQRETQDVASKTYRSLQVEQKKPIGENYY